MAWLDARLLLFFVLVTAALLPLFAYAPVAGMLAFERGADCLGPGSAVSFASAAVYDWHLCLLLGVILVAMFANFGIVVHHWVTPPHPKFVLLPVRLFGIKLHIVSGTTEIFAGALCWFLDDSEAVVRVLVIASFCHSFSSLLLMPGVFGCKAITVPGYTYTICLKIVQAANVWANPDCYWRVLALIATHTIYAWFRISWNAYTIFGLFENCAYTMALITSGCVVLPLLNAWALLGFLLSSAIYWAALQCRSDKNAVYMEKQERGRNFDVASMACPFFKQVARSLERSNTTPNMSSTTIASMSMIGESGAMELHEKRIYDQATLMGLQASEEERARLIFEAINVSGTGSVSFKELSWTLMHTGMPLADAKTIMHRIDTDGSGSIYFDEFKSALRPLWSWAYEDLVKVAKERPKKLEQAAMRKNFFDDANKEYQKEFQNDAKKE